MTRGRRPVDRGLLVVALATSLAGLTDPATANSGGIVGQSGAGRSTCTACHGGGSTPTVAFSGPDEMRVGETAAFRFEVRTTGASQRAAGLNLAASGGMLAIVPGEGTRFVAQVGEITHSAPKGTDESGVAAWEFLWTAPAAAATQTLFGAGNSVNLNGRNTGDRSATATFAVRVVEALDTPTVTPTPTVPPITPTPTAPPVTPTPVDTATPAPCIGDCDGGGSVAVNELIAGVNIALGNTVLATCASFDADGNGVVAVNELIAAVNAALGVCVPG